ncbi:MAG: addiction module protein [Myxococcales bacterium]|nr:addiction module protein [Myxococcales bacterium]MBL0198506.1 addiction module protein [Myxococcales bacterium]
MPPSRLLAEALALPPEEREELATELLRSLEVPPGLSLDDVDEIERRAADVIEGREPGIPWEAVRRRIGL